jgi:hypothetical protein
VRRQEHQRGSANHRASANTVNSRHPVRRRVAQFLIPLVVFGVAVGVAELAGAQNLGTAFGIAQIFFALALLFALLRL